MKALILSGGKGTRLRPITYTSAKQLVPIANKPILFYALEAMSGADIQDVGIIVGDTAAEVMAAVGDGSRWGLQITYIHQDEPRGLAHAVMVAGEYLGDDDFIMYLGDNILRDGVASLVSTFKEKGENSLILLCKVPHPERFGVAEIDGNMKVVRLVEKPAHPVSDLALVGAYVFDKSIHTAVRSILPSGRNEYEITDAIQWLVDNGYAVRPSIVSGWWKDTGKLDDLLEANRLVMETLEPRIEGEVDEGSTITGRVVVEAGASVRRSLLRGPLVIGSGALIEDAYIGPFTSVGDRAVVRDSEVEYSILLDGSCIEGIGARMECSLIGKEAKIRRGLSKPRSYQIMTGDHSIVEVI